MAAASKDESKRLHLLGRSGVKPTFFRIGVRKNRRADMEALAPNRRWAARSAHRLDYCDLTVLLYAQGYREAELAA